MVFEITNGKLSLDDFQVPAQCTIRRVRHGEKRRSEVVDGMTLYYIEKRGSTHYRNCVLPTSVQSVRSLLLCLGERSVGTAGVAAAAFLLKKRSGSIPTRSARSSKMSSWQKAIAATKS